MKYIEKIKNYPIHWALGGTGHESLEQNSAELSAFCEWIEEKKIKKVLEIGCAFGYLGKFLTEEMGLEVHGITLDGDMNRFEYKTLMVGDSTKITIAKKVGNYDLVFIDGNHYQVEKDYENYKGKCKWIAFHDICGLRDCYPVREFWKKVKEGKEFFEFIDYKNIDIAAGIGVIKC